VPKSPKMAKISTNRGPISPKLKKSIKKSFIAGFSEKCPIFLAYSEDSGIYIKTASP